MSILRLGSTLPSRRRGGKGEGSGTGVGRGVGGPSIWDKRNYPFITSTYV
jgi:hypothetical protein